MITKPVKRVIFLNLYIVIYGISCIVLLDNGSQFLLKVFAALCALLEPISVITTEYPLQSNRQVQKYNTALMARLWHLIKVRQTS